MINFHFNFATICGLVVIYLIKTEYNIRQLCELSSLTIRIEEVSRLAILSLGVDKVQGENATNVLSKRLATATKSAYC